MKGPVQLLLFPQEVLNKINRVSLKIQRARDAAIKRASQNIRQKEASSIRRNKDTTGTGSSFAPYAEFTKWSKKASKTKNVLADTKKIFVKWMANSHVAIVDWVAGLRPLAHKWINGGPGPTNETIASLLFWYARRTNKVYVNQLPTEARAWLHRRLNPYEEVHSIMPFPAQPARDLMTPMVKYGDKRLHDEMEKRVAAAMKS